MKQTPSRVISPVISSVATSAFLPVVLPVVLPVAWAVFLLAGATTAASAATAQVVSKVAPEAVPEVVPEVVVTANPFAQAAISTPVEQLSSAALLERPSGGLGETLSGLPGVSSTYFGSHSSRPVIRGLDGDRIRILNNGAALQDASSLSFDHAVAAHPLAVEKLEVVRGPAALMYGGSAVGGVVNMLDNRIARQPLFDEKGGVLGRAQLGFATGNRERLGAVLVETGTDKFALHVDAFGSRAGEVGVPLPLACDAFQGSAQGPSQNLRVQNKICNSQAQASGGALGATLFFDQGYLGLSTQQTRQTYGSPAESAIELAMQNEAHRLEGERRALGWFNGWVQSLSGHWVNHRYQHRELDAGALATTFKSTGFDGQLEAKLRPVTWGANTLQSAVRWQRDRVDFSALGDEAFVPNARTQNQALSVLEQLSAPWGQISGGLRWERADVHSLGLADNPLFAPAQRAFSGNSYALGGLFKLPALGQGWQLALDAARTSRIPKDYELYANGKHAATGAFEVGNPDLPVERSTHTEMGLRWQGDRQFDKANISLYSTRYDNFIFLNSTGAVVDGVPEMRFAPTPARFSGWELSGNARVLQAAASQEISVDLAGRMSAIQATDSATGQPLPRIAPLRTGIDAIFSQGPWRMNVGFDRSAAQTRVAAEQPTTAGYTLWNAGFSFQQKTGGTQLLWFARLHNATNVLAYPATSILTQTAPGRVPLPGRNLRLGVQVQF